jgi:ribosomal protein S18 acetylase RimI-like enzyme
MTIREIDKNGAEELRIVTERCMLAVLETIPEFEGSEVLARQALPNFSHEQMSAMIARDFTDATKRIMVVTASDRLVAQALYSRKIDGQGIAYGSFFSAYVVPEARRKGLALRLMEDALNWFAESQVSYAVAQTHVTNQSVLALAERLGFTVNGPHKAAWDYYTLRLDLAGTP